MPLPVMPGTHRWFRGGPGLKRVGNTPQGGGPAIFASSTDVVWVWDEETGARVTDLLDENATSITSPAIEGGWINGVGIPVGTVIASFSIGEFGKRYELISVQTLKNAQASTAPTDTQVQNLVNDTGSATRGALDSTIAAAVAPKAAITDVQARARLVIPAGAGTADTSALQAAMDDAATNGAPLDVRGVFQINSPLTITGRVHIGGNLKLGTRIDANGCDIFQIAAGVNDVHLENLYLNSLVAYTTTANTKAGIRVQGTNASRCGYHVYRDVYVQGFETAIQTTSLWNTRFDNVHCAYGKFGIDAYGLSENNVVTNCNLVISDGAVTPIAGSVSVRLNGQVSPSDSTAVVSEGWNITDSVLAGGDYGVDAPGYSNYQVSKNFIDFVRKAGVRVRHQGTARGGNALIEGNYIALAGDASTTEGAVEIANTVSGVRGTRIIGNDLLAYAGATAPYGIHLVGSTGASGTVIEGNVLGGFGTNDIKAQCSGNAIVGNRCSSTVTDQIYTDSGQFNLTSDNLASVFMTSAAGFPNTYSVVGGSKVLKGSGAPTALAWKVGDRVVHITPAVGSPKGWVCTVAGTPGTWVSEGNL